MDAAVLAAPSQSLISQAGSGVYQRAKDFLQSLSSRVDIKQISKSTLTLLHEAPESIMRKFFYLGSSLDGSDKYSKQKLDLSELATDLTARTITLESKRPVELKQIEIASPNIHSPQVLNLFSGIRASASKFLKNCAEKFARAGIKLRLMDYTGFGKTYGEVPVCSESLVEDSKLALAEQLKTSTHVNGGGHSLGSAVCASALRQLSEKYKILSGNFISIAGWDDLETVYHEFPRSFLKSLSPLLKRYLTDLFTGRFNTAKNLCELIDKIAANITQDGKLPQEPFRMILVHGMQDKHVSPERTKALQSILEAKIKTLPQSIQKHFQVIPLNEPDAGHFTVEDQNNQIPYQEIIDIMTGSTAVTKNQAEPNKAVSMADSRLMVS